MQRNKHYSKAPIVEAVIDFRVSLSLGEGSAEHLIDIKSDLAESYPIQEEIQHDRVELMAGDIASPQATATRVFGGHRLMSADKLHVLLISAAGFTFSRTRPYDRWSTFRDEARRLWDIYKRQIAPDKVVRCAVRYINRLDLPAEGTLDRYFNLYAEIPSDYPHHSPSGSFLQLQLPQPDIESVLVINQAQVEPANPNKVSIILDFDLFRTGQWSVEEDTELWNFLEVLRIRKNLLFETSITEQTRELIK